MRLLSEVRKLKKQIIMVTQRLYQRGLITAWGGNVSARIEGEDECWITPSGIFKGDLKPSYLVKIDFEGNVIEGLFKPSIEVPFHTEVYKRRPDVNAVVHAHNPIAIGLGNAGVKIRPVHIEAAALGEVPIIPFALPGTKKLAQIIGDNIGNHKAMIMKNHGIVAVGKNLIDAMSVVNSLEDTSLTMLISHLFGNLGEMSPEDFEAVKKM